MDTVPETTSTINRPWYSSNIFRGIAAAALAGATTYLLITKPGCSKTEPIAKADSTSVVADTSRKDLSETGPLSSDSLYQRIMAYDSSSRARDAVIARSVQTLDSRVTTAVNKAEVASRQSANAANAVGSLASRTKADSARDARVTVLEGQSEFYGRVLGSFARNANSLGWYSQPDSSFKPDTTKTDTTRRQ